MALVQARAEQRGKAIKKASITYNLHVCLQKGDSFSGYV